MKIIAFARTENTQITIDRIDIGLCQIFEFETDKHVQSEKAQVQEVLGHAAEDQNQIRTSCWYISSPGSVHTKLYDLD